jgi:hypothetical protein
MLVYGVVPVRITPLVMLERLTVTDSVFHEGQIMDFHGNLLDTMPRGQVIMWQTEQWKHAFYMASELALRDGTKDLFVEVSRKEGRLMFSVVVAGIREQPAKKQLLKLFRSEGFVKAYIKD